ncbi:hypothetical protein [Sulfuricystis multivorans]|uniref:hypothetical protein n=1 Tax=Sulfuricystis multivorans TaxID=2211108 RepID=UPI000F82D398|nr:hypothetical protein [Sulfuricystis multivorans]
MKLKLLLVAFVLSSTAYADVTPMNKTQLVHALKDGAPCCVIDGRVEANRKKRPLGDALPYKEGLQINPTAAVVVVADSDEQALKIASALDTAYPGKRILSVKGGIDAWEAAQVDLSREAASGPPAGLGFMIPRNTCESGSSIQNLKSKFK